MVSDPGRISPIPSNSCLTFSADTATEETIHDLALVESAFRSSKTVNLELRPVHVRLAGRTRGHMFVVMLAYRIIQELALRWQALDVTVAEELRNSPPYAHMRYRSMEKKP